MENNLNRKALILYRWIRLTQSGVSIESLIKNRGIGTLALYGYNEISRCLLYELHDSDINIECIIDKKGRNLSVDIKCIFPDEIESIGADAIVITYTNPKEVINSIRDKAKCDVISFEDIIYEL